jgi:hypothetical protein
MPRFRSTAPSTEEKHPDLVRALELELTSTGDNAQPVILEQFIRPTKSRHIRVIWDRWEGVADEERTQAIVDAYASHERDAPGPEITMAIGLTPDEALASGNLEWLVEMDPAANGDGEQLRRALAAEAARTLLGSRTSKLRYATKDAALAACRRLRAAVPDSTWIVIRDVEDRT